MESNCDETKTDMKPDPKDKIALFAAFPESSNLMPMHPFK